MPPNQKQIMDDDKSQNTEDSSVASDVSSDVANNEMLPLDPGEFHQLSYQDEDDEEDQFLFQKEFSEGNPPSFFRESVYGKPLSEETALELMTNGPYPGEGMTWYAAILPDDIATRKKRMRGFQPRDLDPTTKELKPRRATLPVLAKDFFSSLTKIEGDRYIFSGVLNGWPGLTCLELVRLERRRIAPEFASPKEIMSGQLHWIRLWPPDSTEPERRRKSIHQLMEPCMPEDTNNSILRATLQGPQWSGVGWSGDSPGFVFWYESLLEDQPRFSYGTNMIHTVEEAICTNVHMISHRYAVVNEKPKDKLTYHSLALLEWDHGRYATVVESAYLNGMGGYEGKANWFDDKDEPPTALYKILPPEMILPWRSNSMEVRCYDVPSRNLEEFKEFMEKFTGPTKRFLDPRFTFSHSARLTYRAKSNVAQYLVNYCARDWSYSELKRNCQTFTADLVGFLAGKKGVAPFHPVNRVEYKNRSHLFLYDSGMYNLNKIRRRQSRKPR